MSTKALENYANRHPQLGLLAEITPLMEAGIRLSAGAAGEIVDLGCGEGGTLASLGRRELWCRALGIELSLGRARLAIGNGASVAVGDALRTPCRDRSASMVICRHVIEHVESDRALVREIARILTPEGCLYLETPLRLKGAWYFYRNAGRWVLDPTHVREYTSKEEIARTLFSGGLTPVYFHRRPIAYPIAHVVHRLLSRNSRPTDWIARRINNAKLNVRVPRYRELQVLARLPREGDRDLFESQTLT